MLGAISLKDFAQCVGNKIKALSIMTRDPINNITLTLDTTGGWCSPPPVEFFFRDSP